MTRDVTMLELLNPVTEHTRTEGEVIATIVHMVNSGAVRLCGTFSGARPRGQPAVAAGGLRPGSEGAARARGASMASTGEAIQTAAGGV
jgi:hypothetical protein